MFIIKPLAFQSTLYVFFCVGVLWMRMYNCVYLCVCVAVGRSGAEAKPYVTRLQSEPQSPVDPDKAEREERVKAAVSERGG